MQDREAIKRQVQQSTDLVKLIGEQLSLRPKGKEFVGICPFHDDSNPSMYVSPAKQIYKCFSCGAGGDAFSFVMDYHKMTFPEAMKYLAERAGIELPAFGGGDDSGKSGQREAMRHANERAVRFFQARLADEATGKIARDYLARRGINDEMIEAFAIGYAPDQWNGMSEGVAKRKLDARAFVATGLIAERNDGSFYDRFRHRLIFPIFDAIGRPIAFGGRVLPEGTLDDPTTDAKYLNSPETPLFNKSATLFGLHLAKKPIIKHRTAVIVEGYTDVIACHQAGFANVVATLGTSLTRQHATELRRYCDRVVLVFDGDEAGQKAADRALEVFFNEALDVSIALLPDGMDPADLLANDEGGERWQQGLDDAVDAMAFHFGRVRAAFDAVDSLAGKQRIAEDYLRSLSNLGLKQVDPMRRGLVLGQVAELLKLDTATLNDMIRQLGGMRRQAEVKANAQPSNERGDARTQLERLIVGCLLVRPDLFHEPMDDGRSLDEAVLPEEMVDGPTRAVFQAVHDWLIDHDTIDPTDLRAMMDDEESIRHALDLQLEVERVCGEDGEAIGSRLRRAVQRFRAIVAEQEYRARKITGRQEEAAGPEDDEAARLRRAIEHARTNPSAARAPRVVGQ
jgi:DNA primase